MAMKPSIKWGLAIFLVVAAIAYPTLKMRWIKKQVHTFCAQIKPGDPIAGLESRAKESKLKFRAFQEAKKEKGEKAQPGKIIVWEGVGFARWFCDIEHAGGKIKKTEVVFLD